MFVSNSSSLFIEMLLRVGGQSAVACSGDYERSAHYRKGLPIYRSISSICHALKRAWYIEGSNLVHSKLIHPHPRMQARTHAQASTLARTLAHTTLAYIQFFLRFYFSNIFAVWQRWYNDVHALMHGNPFMHSCTYTHTRTHALAHIYTRTLLSVWVASVCEMSVQSAGIYALNPILVLMHIFPLLSVRLLTHLFHKWSCSRMCTRWRW